MLNKSTISIIEELSEGTQSHPSFFEKDWYTTQLLNALAKVKDPNFQLVFGGGTSLSKAHRLIQRFSEDIDFRIIQTKKNATSNNRYQFRLKVAEALNSFAPNLILSNAQEFTKRQGGIYFQGEIEYEPHFKIDSSLRDYIKLELSFRQLALEPSMLQLSSIVNQFTRQTPEVDGFQCVSLAETAADKIAALSWRVVGMEPNDPNYDPRIIRHLYDLSYLAPQVVNDPQWSKLSLETVANDLKTRSKTLASKISSPQELLSQLVIKLVGNKFYRESYRDFVEELTYGESLPFEQAIETLNLLSDRLGANRQQAKGQQLERYLSDEDSEEITEGFGIGD